MNENEAEKVVPDGGSPSQASTPVTKAPRIEAIEPPPQQRWNNPRINMWRTFVACYGLFIMGANDAAYGVSYPSLISRKWIC